MKFIVQIVFACAQSKSLPYQIILLQNHTGQFLDSFPDVPNPILLGYIMELVLGISQEIFFEIISDSAQYISIGQNQFVNISGSKISCYRNASVLLYLSYRNVSVPKCLLF